VRAGAFRALEHRNFRVFSAGQLISLVGTWMQIVAQGWLVLKLTNSPWMLGVVSFASYIPIPLVALFAGVIVDQVDRRRLIVCTQTLMMLSAFTLAALTYTGVVRVEYVIALAMLNGFVSSFDMPGRQAFIVEMVGREDLPNAIALNSMAFNGARAVGPAIAGLLIVVSGIAGCFFLNGLSYLAVIASLFAMDVPRREPSRFGNVMLVRMREGLSYAWHHRPTFYLFVVLAISAGFSMQYSVLVPYFAAHVLHQGAKGYGFLLAAQGVGAVLGAVGVASRSHDPRHLRLHLIVGLFAMAASIGVFGVSRSFALSMIAQMVNGAGQLSYQASTNMMLQLFVADELRGRVMSIYTVAFIGLAPIGSLEVGFAGAHLGAAVATVICAVIGLGCAFLLLSKHRLLIVNPAGAPA
jgi:MFS family permease